MRGLVAVSVVLGILTACGTETGNPEATIAYNARSSDPETVPLGDTDGAHVSEVWLGLDDLAITPCGGGDPVVVEGLGLADHGGDSAARQTATLEDPETCELSTRFYADAAFDGPAETEGRSIVVVGALSDDRPFVIAVAADVDLRLEVDADPDHGDWLITFDVAEWVDLAALEAVEGDAVTVDATSNPELLEAFVDRLLPGIRVHADENGNGNVDDSEPELSLE